MGVKTTLVLGEGGEKVLTETQHSVNRVYAQSNLTPGPLADPDQLNIAHYDSTQPVGRLTTYRSIHKGRRNQTRQDH